MSVRKIVVASCYVELSFVSLTTTVTGYFSVDLQVLKDLKMITIAGTQSTGIPDKNWQPQIVTFETT